MWLPLTYRLFTEQQTEEMLNDSQLKRNVCPDSFHMQWRLVKEHYESFLVNWRHHWHPVFTQRQRTDEFHHMVQKQSSEDQYQPNHQPVLLLCVCQCESSSAFTCSVNKSDSDRTWRRFRSEVQSSSTDDLYSQHQHHWVRIRTCEIWSQSLSCSWVKVFSNVFLKNVMFTRVQVDVCAKVCRNPLCSWDITFTRTERTSNLTTWGLAVAVTCVEAESNLQDKLCRAASKHCSPCKLWWCRKGQRSKLVTGRSPINSQTCRISLGGAS